jgi:hypothetical protein
MQHRTMERKLEVVTAASASALSEMQVRKINAPLQVTSLPKTFCGIE